MPRTFGELGITLRAWESSQTPGTFNLIGVVAELAEGLAQRLDNLKSEYFTYIDPVVGAVTVGLMPRHGETPPLLLKNGVHVPVDSAEAEPLLAHWARLKLSGTF